MISPKLEKLQIFKDEIVKCYNDGGSFDSLAPLYGVNPSTIRRFLISAGVKLHFPLRPKILEKHSEEVISLYRSGWRTTRLAQKFDVDINTVSYFLKTKNVRRSAGIRDGKFFIERDVDKGMLAGLLLGEGSIVIRGKSARISIVNQDSSIIGWLGRFGGTIHWSKPRKSALNPCAVWHLSRAIDVFHCLNILLPLLVGKKKNLAVAAINVLKHGYGFEIPKEDPAP